MTTTENIPKHSFLIDLEVAISERHSERNTATDIIIYNLLIGINQRAHKVVDELSLEKYRLAFIGSIGAGKTTAICYLMDLAYKRMVERTIAGKRKEREEVTTLLTTAAGGTTLCEIEIVASDKVGLTIEPYNNEQTLKLLTDFAEILIFRFSGQPVTDPDPVNAADPIPQELERALRNLVGMPTRRISTQGTDNNSNDVSSQSNRMDDAEVLYKRLQKEGKGNDEFIRLIIENANLNDRNLTSFEPDGNENIDEWIFKTYQKINVCVVKNMALPKRIIIHWPSSDSLRSYSAVIDTKGLDSPSPRENIDKLLRDTSTICILASGYNAAPEGNVLEFLKRNTEYNGENDSERHVFLVLPRGGDPENTLQPDGTKADDWNIGIDYKKTTVINSFISSQIEISDENIIFFNPLRFYTNSNKPDPDYIDEISSDKQEVLSTINTIIEKRKLKLNERLIGMQQIFGRLLQGQLSDDETALLAEMKTRLLLHQNLNFIANTLKNELIDIYRNNKDTRNARRKHGLNRSTWYYDYPEIDVYYLLTEEYARHIVRQTTINIKKKISQILSSEKGSSSPLFAQVGDELVKLFNQNYKEFVEESISSFRGLLTNEIETDSLFFERLVAEYGRGQGYTNRVCEHFAEIIEEKDIAEQFQNEVEKLWLNLVMKFAEIL